METSLTTITTSTTMSTTTILILLLLPTPSDQFRKADYLENSKLPPSHASHAAPVSAKYNDVFEIVDVITTTSPIVVTTIANNDQNIHQVDFANDNLKKEVQQAHHSESDFQVNGVLYSEERQEDRTRDILSDLKSDSGSAKVQDGDDTATRGTKESETLNVLESVKEDLDEARKVVHVLSRRIHSAINRHNCSTHEIVFPPDYLWPLDGHCSQSTKVISCTNSSSCSTSLHYPSSSNSFPGRSGHPLFLDDGVVAGTCAVRMSGRDYVDFGEWPSSCLVRPERCSAGGLSATGWLRPGQTFADGGRVRLFRAGDGLDVTAVVDEDRIKVKVSVNDGIYIWFAEGSTTVKKDQWLHWVIAWKRVKGLDVYIDGRLVTEDQWKEPESGNRSAAARMLIGIPPGNGPEFSGEVSVAKLALYVSHLDSAQVAEIFARDKELNVIDDLQDNNSE